METENLHLVVGKKQILRLMKENALQRIQIATNADAEYIQSIVSAAKAHNLTVEFSGTMEEIAQEHGIDVPCGAVGFLKD